MDSKACEGRFLGYAPNAKGYRVYWPNKRTVGIERNVRFVESEPAPVADEQLKGAKTDKGNLPVQSEPPAPPIPAPVTPSLPPSPIREPQPAIADDKPEEAALPEQALGRGQRIRKPSEYVLRLQRGEGTADGCIGSAPKGVQADKVMGATALVVTDESDNAEHIWSEDDYHLHYPFEHALVIQAGQEPLTLAQAQASPDWPHWKIAIDKENANLLDHDTYELVEPPTNMNIVGCRYVFRVKRNADGTITLFKARLVAQGHTQVPGLDFNETFAPVAKLSSIRTILALAARYDWELEQMDVKSAYLNGRLDETIYMRQPPRSAAPGKEHLVCRLKKTLYGLKQAGRGWYKTLSAAMNTMGLTRCAADHAMWYRRDGDSTLIVASSVDDLTIAGTPDLVAAFKSDIKSHFDMSDLGPMHWILSIEVQRNRTARTLAISQRAYIDTIVARFNPATTPLQPGGALGKHQSPATPRQFEEMRDVPYREAVGSLMYAAMGTRPDVTFAVTALSQFMQNPGRAHWDAVKRVLRYLKGTRELWLVYGDTRNGVKGFSDADWGSTTEHRHSISSYVYTLDGGAISWSAKKQNVVALSSTEAEYIALTHAAKEALWLRYILADIIHPDIAKHPLTLHCDNRSAIALAKDNAFHPRTKHIDIRFHFIREAVEDNKLTLEHLRTEDMPADLFTKALPHPRLEHLSALFGLRSL